MAYDKEKLIRDAVRVVEADPTIVFITELVCYLPCEKSTFYALNMDKSDVIKAALNKNRVTIKSKLRKKWVDSDNATLNIALYKLIGDEKEFDRLAKTNLDHTSKGDKINLPAVSWTEPDEK